MLNEKFNLVNNITDIKLTCLTENQSSMRKYKRKFDHNFSFTHLKYSSERNKQREQRT
jgi:hypothetical protein